MEFLEAIHPEWCQMWENLSLESINRGDPMCLFMGKCWEYMGSTADHHHFRHAIHPCSRKTEFAYLERRGAALSWAC